MELQLGNLAEWATAVLAAVAGVVAIRALRLQQAADAQRDAEIEQRAREARASQAVRVHLWAEPLAEGALKRQLRLSNRSDGPIYFVRTAYDRTPEEAEPVLTYHDRTHTLEVVPPGKVMMVEYDVPSDDLRWQLDATRIYVQFVDGRGRVWMRCANGHLVAIDESRTRPSIDRHSDKPSTSF